MNKGGRGEETLNLKKYSQKGSNVSSLFKFFYVVS